MFALVREVSDELLTEYRQDYPTAPWLEVKFMESLPSATGDYALIRQVWVNLLSNAIKFTRYQDQPRIEIGAASAGREFVTYYVRDNGAGFDMQNLNKLFGPFQRLHSGEEFEGTGIGLALSQRIIQRHGGTIWGEGQPGHGARFAFTLPEWAPPS
jgi:two-component system, sensor histidine kinase and response regulator